MNYSTPEGVHDLGISLKEILDPYDIDPEDFLKQLSQVLTERNNDMPKKVVKVDLDQDMTALLTQWKKVSEELAEKKSEESQLRMKLVVGNFDATKLEGSQTIDIGWGWKLKATKKLNLSATNEGHQTEQLLAAIAAVDPGLAVGLVRWSPELSTTVYRQLLKLVNNHPDLAKFMSEAITVKPGMPELEMIPPKEEAPADVVVESGVTITDGNFPKGF